MAERKTIPRHAQRLIGKPAAGVVPTRPDHAIEWWDPADDYRPYLRLQNGTDIALTGAEDEEGDYVVQLGNASLDQLRVNGQFFKFKPPTSAPKLGDLLLAISDVRETDGSYGVKTINPGQFGGLRFTSFIPQKSTDPGLTGDVSVDAATGRAYLGLVRPDGNNWIRLKNVDVTFNQPTGVPVAPVLSAKVEGGQVVLSWTHPGGEGLMGFEVFESLGGVSTRYTLAGTTGATARTFTRSAEALSTGAGFFRVRAWSEAGSSSFSGEVTVSLSVTAPELTERHLIWNTFEGGLVSVVDTYKDRPITGINFWVRWHDLEPQPGVFAFDNLVAALQRCREVGLVAEVTVFLHRQANTNGDPQDYEDFFPASHLTKWSDGSVYHFDNIVGRQSVMPSMSSTPGRTAIASFFAGLAQRTKPFHEAGTLLDFSFVTGKDGEWSYPFNDSTKLTTDFADIALPDFQAWCQAKHGTIAALNTAWGTSHASFSAIGWPWIPAPPGDPEPAINSEARRDQFRWRIENMGKLATAIQTAVKSQSAIPVVAFLSELGGGYLHNIAAGTTGIAYLCKNLDGIYSSAGWNLTLEKSKASIPDIVYGTLGPGKIVSCEFDQDDLSSNLQSGAGANWDAVAQLYEMGKRFYDKGGRIIHLQDIGGSYRWDLVTPHAERLLAEYCTAPNNKVTPRSPVAEATYNYADQVSGADGGAHWTAWYSVQGQNRQVDIEQVDNFTGLTPPAPPPPVRVPQIALSLVAGSAADGGSVVCVGFEWRYIDTPTLSQLWYQFAESGQAFSTASEISALPEYTNGSICVFGRSKTYRVRMRAVTTTGSEIHSNVVEFSLDANGALVTPSKIFYAQAEGGVEVVRVAVETQPNGKRRLRETMLAFNVPPGYGLYRVVSDDFEFANTAALYDYGDFAPRLRVNVLWVVAKGLAWWHFAQDDPQYILQTAFARIDT